MIKTAMHVLAISAILTGVMACQSAPEVDVDATVEARLAEASRAQDAASAEATIAALKAQVEQQTPTPAPQAAEPDLAATIAALESRLQQVAETGTQSSSGQSSQALSTDPPQ